MQQIPDVSQADPRTGMWFVFDVPEGCIAYWGSAQSGRAAIHVDGERVARMWRLGVRSSYTVRIGTRTYDIALRVNVSRGTHECVLQSGTQVLQGCSAQYVNPRKNALIWASTLAWPAYMAGHLLGYFEASSLLPLCAAFVAAAAVYGSNGGHFVVAPIPGPPPPHFGAAAADRAQAGLASAARDFSSTIRCSPSSS